MKNNQVSKKSLVCLLGLLLLSCLFIFKNFLFGNQVLVYTDIGSDTYDQYLLHYQSIINHIREGNFSLWDFNNGYGVNMFTYNLFDPFLLLVYLAGVLFGAEQIYSILVYWVILHILLAGIAIYLFLSCFHLSERAKVFASYIYALCGYMVVWGQHYHFGTVVVLFPLLLMAVEYSFRKYKWHIGITVFCALASLASLYMAYMQFIVLGFYVLFRVAWQEKLFSFNGIKRVGKVYGSMILGIGIGLVQLLPSASLILNVTGRVSKDSFLQRVLSMITLYPEKYYEVLIKRFLSSNTLGVNEYMGYTNYYEDPNVFLSALLLIAFVQFVYFFFVEKHSKKQRFLLVLACGAFGFMLLIPLGGAIFNAFAYPFSRHTFLCMPFGVWVIAYVLHEIFEQKKCNIPLLILSTAGILGCYVLVALGSGKKVPLLLGVLTLGMGISILGYLRLWKSKMRDLCLLALLGCIILTMSGDAYLAYSKYRITLEKPGSEYMENLYDQDVKQAVDYLKTVDTSFYRIEKDYTVGTDVSCLNAMAQNYRGISTYNSILNTNVTDMLSNLWPNSMVVNSAHYSFANSVNEDLPASLSHVKYVLSKNENYSAPGYTLLKQFGDIYIYQNTNTKDIAKFYTNTVTSADYAQAVSSGKQQDLLANYLVCDSLPETQVKWEELDLQEKIPAAAPDTVYTSITDDSVLNLHFEQVQRETGEKYIVEFDIAYIGGNNYVSILSGGAKTFTSIQSTPTRLSFTLPVNDDKIQIHPSSGMLITEIQISNIAVYKCESTNLSGLSEGISFDNPEKDSIVSGTADIKETGVLMLAIPYEDGWRAYVDGEEAEVHKVDFGFSGIVLEEGEHEIKMRFECPGFAPGAAISASFLLVTMVIWANIFIQKKSKK